MKIAGFVCAVTCEFVNGWCRIFCDLWFECNDTIPSKMIPLDVNDSHNCCESERACKTTRKFVVPNLSFLRNVDETSRCV